MKKRQKSIHEHAQKHSQRHPLVQHEKTNEFLDAFINCSLLFGMKAKNQFMGSSIEHQQELPLVAHVFANHSHFQQLPKPSLNVNTSVGKHTNNKSLFDTFNHTDFSHNQEEEQYSVYLKEYETLKKESFRKQGHSSKPQTNEMDMLIHQFLSDITPPTTTNKKGITETTKSQKNGKVDKVKIDLNVFQTGGSFGKPMIKQKEQSIEKKKEGTPRFINLNDAKAKPKKSIDSRQKSQRASVDRKSIEVIKVTNLGPKQRLIKPEKQLKKFVIAKDAQKAPQMAKMAKPKQFQQRMEIKYEKSAEKGSFNSYSKSKQLRETNKFHQRETKIEETPSSTKKPIKIDIQLPIELSSPQRLEVKKLQEESHMIIKDISHSVLSLLQKSKQIRRPPK